MKLGIKAGIISAASVALIGGVAFAAPSFAADTTQSPQSQSQEKRQLHKAEHSVDGSAECDHEKAGTSSASEKGGHKGEGKRIGAQGKGEGPHSNS